MSEHVVDWRVEGDEDDVLLAEGARLADNARALLALLAEDDAADRGKPLVLSLLLCDDAFILPLNEQWRGVGKATDVLSFPLNEGAALGDVVISVETATRRVDGPHWRLEDELLFLLLHGVLHLLGHDHMEPGEQRVMEAAEQRLWTAMGRAGTLR